MNNSEIPAECAKQWEVLLLLLSSEEKKIDRTCENEVDTMNYFLSNKSVRKILLQWLHQMESTYGKKVTELDTALKCDDIALLWRLKGNDMFRDKFLKGSYKCYSKSICYAVQTGPMYPLALANRAAANLRMKEYKACLTDLSMALDCGYPLEQRHKLFLRKADCHIELNQRGDALAAIAAAKLHMNIVNFSETQKIDNEKNLEMLEKRLEALENKGVQSEDIALPDCYLGMNPNFKAASNAVELKHSETAGRFVITKEASKRGDILFSEEPYAWVTLPSKDAVCEMCCQANINLLSCIECSRSFYCSQQCRTRADPAFHRWECAGAQSDLFRTIGIAHLALRVLLVTAHEGFPGIPKGQVSGPLTAADVFQGYSSVDNIEIYKSNEPPFLRMFNLVTNFDKMANADYIQYALTATMLTLYLENFTSFFEYLPTRLPFTMADDQVKLFAAALILRSLGQLVCNGHATLCLTTCEEEEENDGGDRTVTEQEVRRATAIYPSAAMMNHSCDPNIINTFYKGRLIIRCARDLPAGTEVSNCYGPHRAREPTAQRRALLRAQYMFTCNCTACTDVGRRDSVLMFSAYACQACKGPVLLLGGRAQCQQCHADFVVERALAAIEKADEILQQAERMTSLEDKCELIYEAYKLKHQTLHRHHESLRNTGDQLARLYADMGEYSKSVELIKQNIQSLEFQFDSFSAEVAHEMSKLSGVMFERLLKTSDGPDFSDQQTQNEELEEVSTILCFSAEKHKRNSIEMRDKFRERRMGEGRDTVVRNRLSTEFGKQLSALSFLITSFNNCSNYFNLPDDSIKPQGDESNINLEAETNENENPKQQDKNRNVVDYLEAYLEANREKSDELTLFFKSITQTVQDFPKEKQIQIKRQVYDMVHDMQLALLLHPTQTDLNSGQHHSGTGV